MTTIILAEDHDVVLTGLKLLIESQPDLQVVGTGKEGQEILTILRNGTIPHILITDLNMSGMNGFDLIDQVRTLYPSVRIIILSMSAEVSDLLKSFEHGASGYLLKTVDYEEMFYGIKKIGLGSKFICADMTFSLIKSLGQNPFAFQESASLIKEIGLTQRELEVLQLIGDGLGNAQIAEKLFLSKRTVEGHRQSLLEKVNVKNTASLIKYAVLRGLIS